MRAAGQPTAFKQELLLCWCSSHAGLQSALKREAAASSVEEQLKEKEAIEAENAATNAKIMENEAQVSAECSAPDGTFLVSATTPDLSCSWVHFQMLQQAWSSCLRSCGHSPSGRSECLHMDADACFAG